MGTYYSQLSNNDRHVTEVFVRLGIHPAAIARFLGRHRSTICREVSRARAYNGASCYVAHFGQLYSERARKNAGLARRKLGCDFSSPAWLHVRQGLAAGLSPQLIAGRLADSCFIPGSHLLHPAFVSHQTIYCAIYALPRGTLRTELMSQLLRSRSGRQPRRNATSRSTQVQDMTPISLRPPEVAARIVPGHWEGDLINGAGGRSVIGTLVERSSRYIMLVRLDGCSAQNILDGFSHRLRSIPPELRRTLTYDQASEMAMHKSLTNPPLLAQRHRPLTFHRQEPRRPRVRPQQHLAESSASKLPTKSSPASKSMRSQALHFKLESARSQHCCMPQVIISGAPGVGKTTLLAELSRLGYATVTESAREVISERLARGQPPRPDPETFAR
jgi:IS30 family transposase